MLPGLALSLRDSGVNRTPLAISLVPNGLPMPTPAASSILPVAPVAAI